MHDTALTEIKALLTLALLKSGTCARDIQNAIDVAATTRLIAGEECAAPDHDDANVADGRITNIRDLRHGDTAAASRERKRRQPISGLNGARQGALEPAAAAAWRNVEGNSHDTADGSGHIRSRRLSRR